MNKDSSKPVVWVKRVAETWWMCEPDGDQYYTNEHNHRNLHNCAGHGESAKEAVTLADLPTV